MQEEEKVVTGEVVVDNTDYIAAIKELKQNSVDRSKYDALKAENKKLLDSIVNGTEIAQPTVEDKPDIKELRKAVFETGRKFIYNEDFILYLKEEDKEKPYFALKVDNTDVLVAGENN